MGSEGEANIPVIDFSTEKLKAGTSSWVAARDSVRRALEEQGWFIAEYDQISLDFHNSIFSVTEEALDLPHETKMKNFNPKPSFGYMSKISNIPLHESLGIDDATVLEACQNFTKLMWPQGNDRFCECAHLYAQLVAKLEQIVMRMVFESYGIEKHYESHVESSTYLLKLVKYMRPTKEEDKVDFVSHSDKTFLTILHQNHVKGLELRTKDGSWIFFEPSPSSFVVMAGDACMAWSNERIKPGYHRILVENENEIRYSLAFFSFQKDLIKVPEELVDEEHPLQYKPFDQISFIRFYVKSGGKKCKYNVLKAYCGT